MMAQPVKFQFDRNLDPNHVDEPEPEVIELADHEARLAAARDAAFAQGVAEGRKQAGEEAETRFANQAAGLTKSLDRAFKAIDAAIAEHEIAAADLAMTLARRLAPTLIAREPAAEIEALLRQSIGQLHAVPHLMIRVNDAAVDIARMKLDPIAEQAGFTGRLIVMGEPDIAIGDCRIEWAEGSIVRSIGDMDQATRDAVTGYIAARADASKGQSHG